MSLSNNLSSEWNCYPSSVNISIGVAFNVCKTLLVLPLCVLILHAGYQQWRPQCSFATASHFEFFTYHLVVMEVVSFVGYCFILFGAKFNIILLQSGRVLCSLNVYGEICFNTVTCVERYLAVVHPVTYQGLRNARGVKIRNIGTGVVWYVCMSLSFLNSFYPEPSVGQVLGILVVSLAAILFCSVSVLRVLIRPQPGKQARPTERINQSRKRALDTIVTIFSFLFMWLTSYIVSNLLVALGNFTAVLCVIMYIIIWFNVPCAMLLPMLYLTRTRKVACKCLNAK